MSIEQPEDLAGMRRAGVVVRDTLAALSAAVCPGVTTLDLDRHGTPLRELGRIVERSVRRDGFAVVRELGGHGVGRTIHEPPHIWNFAHPHERGRLHAGQVITIEPIVAAGSGDVIEDADGWTVRTRDGSLSAYVEHTLLITRGAPTVLTA